MLHWIEVVTGVPVLRYGSIYSNLGNAITFDGTDRQVSTVSVVNTQSYGTSPLGANGPYNSLNFGLNTSAPTVGSDTYPGSVINNNVLESGWSPYTPQVQFTAAPEPGTWVLMLGSLVAVIFATRRRVKA